MQHALGGADVDTNGVVSVLALAVSGVDTGAAASSESSSGALTYTGAGAACQTAFQSRSRIGLLLYLFPSPHESGWSRRRINKAPMAIIS